MHPIAVDGSSALSAFLSHHQPPSPTYRHRHTLLPSSPRPVTKEQLSVSHGGRMQLLCSSSDKRDVISSVDMTVARDTPTMSGNHLVSFRCWQNTLGHGRTHLGVENDPTIKIRCRRSLLNTLLELLEATVRHSQKCPNRTKRNCLHSQ